MRSSTYSRMRESTPPKRFPEASTRTRPHYGSTAGKTAALRPEFLRRSSCVENGETTRSNGRAQPTWRRKRGSARWVGAGSVGSRSRSRRSATESQRSSSRVAPVAHDRRRAGPKLGRDRHLPPPGSQARPAPGHATQHIQRQSIRVWDFGRPRRPALRTRQRIPRPLSPHVSPRPWPRRSASSSYAMRLAHPTRSNAVTRQPCTTRAPQCLARPVRLALRRTWSTCSSVRHARLRCAKFGRGFATFGRCATERGGAQLAYIETRLERTSRALDTERTIRVVHALNELCSTKREISR